MLCPLCDREAGFTPVFSESGEVVYRCHACGGISTEKELRLANTEPATEVVQ